MAFELASFRMEMMNGMEVSGGIRSFDRVKRKVFFLFFFMEFNFLHS